MAASDIHLVFAAFPGYGHVRPLKALMKSLTATGYSATFLTASSFESSLSSIDGVDFVPFRGKADMDPSDIFGAFPERAKQPQDATIAVWDVEHIFFGCMDDMFKVIQEVITRPDLANKKVVILTDGFMTGALPILLQSPQTRRVPVVAVANFPYLTLSKDTAPFGFGLPPQDQAKNQELNGIVVQTFAKCQAACESLMEKYECRLPMPSEFPLDTVLLTPDAYLQLTVPQMEYPRSDLPGNFQFVGTLLGANDNKGNPDWWQSFVLEGKDPLIVVTSGTLTTMDASQLIKPTIEACRDLPVRLVVCAVHAKLEEGYEVPANVRVADWLPFEELFPQADVVVTNGGYGGINQAFAYGCPMVVAGLTEDKVETTARAAMTGAAINLKTQTPSTEQMRESLTKMLEDKSFKQRATELKKAYAELDTVRLIEDEIVKQAKSFYG